MEADIIDSIIYATDALVIDEQETQDAYQRVFSSPDGEKILKDLIVSFRLRDPRVITDANAQYFSQGQKSVMTQIKTRLYTDYTARDNNDVETVSSTNN